MPATAPRFRFLGTTDDVIDCERCGKADLRATVVLEALDADGNSEAVVYFGSDCAARALAAAGGRRTTAATVRKLAEAANHETAHQLAESERLLAHYEPVAADDDRLIAAYARAHQHAMWLSRTTDAELLGMARDCLTRHRTRLATLRTALHPAAAPAPVEVDGELLLFA